jgi:hypothetical protein
MRPTTTVALTIGGIIALIGAAAAQGAGTPVPKPFPGASQSAPATTGSPASASSQPDRPRAETPAVQSGPKAPPSPLPTTVPMYPSADFLDTFDAGLGQRYYLYGSNLPYADMVTFYRSALKNSGRELYKAPGMYQFDLGKYQEDSMAYPPSVVIKDYWSANSPGYLFVSGTTEKRYRTIIQVVPPGPAK